MRVNAKIGKLGLALSDIRDYRDKPARNYPALAASICGHNKTVQVSNRLTSHRDVANGFQAQHHGSLFAMDYQRIFIMISLGKRKASQSPAHVSRQFK